MFVDVCQYGSLWSVRMSCQQIGADCFCQTMSSDYLKQPLNHSSTFQMHLNNISPLFFTGPRCLWIFFRFSCKDYSSLVLVIRHVFHFTSKMLFAMGDYLSYGVNTLGPLCLWQCLQYNVSPLFFFTTQQGSVGLFQSDHFSPCRQLIT